MPVSTENSVSGPYTPNGVTTDFSFDFKATAADEVVALDQDGETISSALYSVTLDDDEGGVLSFSVAPVLSDYSAIFVVGNPALTQPSDFDNAGPSFNPASLTRALDRAATRDLRQQREIDRTPKVGIGATPPSIGTISDGQVVAQVEGDLVGIDNDLSSAEDAAARANTSQAQAAANETSTANYAALAAISEANAEAYRDATLANAGMFASTAAAVGNGVNAFSGLVGGSGGTDGTFAVGLTGGTEDVAAVGTFTVASGSVSDITITRPGYYSVDPTGFDFSASSGLTGASATPVMAANTVDGEYFQVPSASGEGYVDLHSNSSGSASAVIDTLPNKDKLDSIYDSSDTNPAVFTPLFKDEADNIPIWLEDGAFDAPALGSTLQAWLDAYVGLPLVYGRETQGLLDVALSTFAADASGAIKIAMFGDSWFGRQYFTNEMLRRFAERSIDMASSGWSSLETSGASGTTRTLVSFTTQSNGTSISSSAIYGSGVPADEWVMCDASFNDANIALGVDSPDGLMIYTTRASDEQTLTFSNLKGTDLHLRYVDLDGAFRYRVDGGSWTTLAGGNTGNGSWLSITGLAASTHTLEIDTSVNTAGNAVRIGGAYATGGFAGVEVSKMGNGGATSINIATCTAAMADFVTLAEPDQCIIHLGVNDQRLSGSGTTTPSAYNTSMQSIITALRAAQSDISLLLLQPPYIAAESDASNFSMAEYAAKTRALAKANNAAYADFTVAWDDFDTEDARGAFEGDGFHLNDAKSAAAYTRYVGLFFNDIYGGF